MRKCRLLLPFVASAVLFAQQQQAVEVVRVVSKRVQRQVKLPGEFLPYLTVPIHAKVSGFVKTVRVDTGSMVRKGEVLATLEAPEMQAQVAEAESNAQAVNLQRAEAEAKLASAQSTYERLKAAAETPGVVAGNDVVVAQKGVEAAQAQVRSYEGSYRAAQASIRALKDLERYLTITAPFAGVIVERDVHPGALVGPNAAAGAPPLLRLQQSSRLRLVVSVPENLVGGIVRGAAVAFNVPAYPGEIFHGVIARIPHLLDEKTRSMNVDLDVSNPGLRLAPRHVSGGELAGALTTSSIACAPEQHCELSESLRDCRRFVVHSIDLIPGKHGGGSMRAGKGAIRGGRDSGRKVGGFAAVSSVPAQTSQFCYIFWRPV